MEEENFIIEEYKASWTYYMKTLDERKNLFDWYLKIVALPAVVFGIISRSPKLEFSPMVNCIIFSLVALVGLSLFITYVKESSNSDSYIQSLKAIRKYYLNQHPKLEEFLILNARKDKYEKMGGIKFWRSSIFFVINSALVSISSYFLLAGIQKPDLWLIPIIVFTCFLIFHVLIFRILISSYKSQG